MKKNTKMITQLKVNETVNQSTITSFAFYSSYTYPKTSQTATITLVQTLKKNVMPLTSTSPPYKLPSVIYNFGIVHCLTVTTQYFYT